MIPKIIWQTHEWEWDNLPEKYKKQSTSWKKHNPGWNYKYCSSKKRLEHMESFGKKYLESYLKIDDKIMQSDFWRYSVIYNFGGIYIDMDTICIKDNYLDTYLDLNKELIVCGSSKLRNTTNNHAFAGEKKSPFLKEFIDVVINNINKEYNIRGKILTGESVSKTTGPNVWSESIVNYTNKLISKYDPSDPRYNAVGEHLSILHGNQYKLGVPEVDEEEILNSGFVCICCGRPFK